MTFELIVVSTGRERTFRHKYLLIERRRLRVRMPGGTLISERQRRRRPVAWWCSSVACGPAFLQHLATTCASRNKGTCTSRDHTFTLSLIRSDISLCALKLYIKWSYYSIVACIYFMYPDAFNVNTLDNTIFN